MKIHQYNQRVQYWYDRCVRTWFCATNNSAGSVTCTAIDSYTKKDCLENCIELEEEIQTASIDFDSKNFSERKWEHQTYGK